jgi:CheY-like chemotaxis protein
MGPTVGQRFFSLPTISGSPTILCVDDEAGALLIRKTILERSGYLVATATNAEDALKIFGSNRIDLVVTDHLLSGATGTEMARQMKQAKPDVPILLLSGLVDPPAGTEYTDGFIDKGQGPEKLLETIAAVMSKHLPVASSVSSTVTKSCFEGQKDCDNCAATMAHEINNPLDSLLNLLYLVDAEATLTEKGSHYLDVARDEVCRISQIAHAALDGFRDTAGPKETNLPKLVGSVVDFYKSRFEGRGISFQTRYCPDGALSAYASPLRQVFSNLLVNAAHAMPNGGRMHARVSMAREWSGQERRGLRITIADNGCGIPEANQQQIWEPFFSTKGCAGSGLGLPLVKDVVQKHGGALRVRSSTTLGHSGSVFTIFLPEAFFDSPTRTLDKTMNERSSTSSISSDDSPVSGRNSFRYRILVVDDEENLRTMARTILESQGYEVMCAVDGFEGLSTLRQSLPDVIISDLRMPNMNGFEFLSVVRTRFPQIPIIAISGEFSGIGVPDSVLADAFFAKGQYTLKELFQKIIVLLEHGPIRPRAKRQPRSAVWVPLSTDVNYIAVTCPSCLRTFSVSAPLRAGTNTANCDFCVAPVSFEIPEEFRAC